MAASGQSPPKPEPSTDEQLSAMGVQLIATMTCFSLSLAWALFSWAPLAWGIVYGSVLASSVGFGRLDRDIRWRNDLEIAPPTAGPASAQENNASDPAPALLAAE